MTGIAARCARAASGQAATPPPSALMKSRRLILPSSSDKTIAARAGILEEATSHALRRGERSLFRRRVVQLGALVHDMDRQIFEWRISEHFQSRMRNVAAINCACASGQRDLLAVSRFERRALKDIERFLAMMNMALDRFARLIFDHGDDDFHVRARQIGALELLPALGIEAVLSMREAGECNGGDGGNEPRPGDTHASPPLWFFRNGRSVRSSSRQSKDPGPKPGVLFVRSSGRRYQHWRTFLICPLKFSRTMRH